MQQVGDFVSFYHPDILFFTETKVNSDSAKKIIERLNFHFLFDMPLIGLNEGLWLLLQNSLEFHLEILSHSDRFIHYLIKDDNNNFE